MAKKTVQKKKVIPKKSHQKPAKSHKAAAHAPHISHSHEKEILYVGVSDPTGVRRQVLEASKDMIRMMQQLERFKEVRKERLEAIQGLRDDLRAIKGAFQKLRRVLPIIKLPKHKLAQANQPMMQEERVEQEKIEEKPQPKMRTDLPSNEIDRLEGELDAIEKKLESLT